MNKLISIISCAIYLFFAVPAIAQSTTALNADSIIITNNPSDIANCIEMGTVDIKVPEKGLRVAAKDKKLKEEAELDLKQQAIKKDANIVLVTVNEVANIPGSGIGLHMAGILYKGRIAPNAGQPTALVEKPATALTVDSVVLVKDPDDVSYLIQVGSAQVQSAYNKLSLKKKYEDAEKQLKQKAIAMGANIMYITETKSSGETFSLRGGGDWEWVTMTANFYVGKIRGRGDNNSSAATINNSDLSGKWEGMQTNGQMIMQFEINLKKIGENMYSGYDYHRWLRANNSPYGVDAPNAKKVFVAVLKDNVLTCSELGNIENGNWPLENESFRLINANGTMAFVGENNIHGGQWRTAITRTGDYPQDYLKYVVGTESLKIDTVIYHNPNPSSSIGYNQKGYLEFSIDNTTANNFKGLSIKLDFGNGGEGIASNNAGNVWLDAGANEKKPLRVALSTNLGIPANTIMLHLSIYSNGNLIAGKYFSVPTDAFLKSSNITMPVYSSGRMQAVAGFYGFLKTPYAKVGALLDPMVSSGDKIAGMWKAVFLSMGYGGYKFDEDGGYALAKSCVQAVEEKARKGDAEALYLMFYACQMGLEGAGGSSFGAFFLQKAAESGFKPALYDYGAQFILQKDFSAAFANLRKSYDQGVTKAAAIIGVMFEKGYGVSPDVDSAVAWYKKGMAFGDPAATLNYAGLILKGINNVPPDANKAIGIATSAAAKNYSAAMIFLGSMYVDGKRGIARNLPEAIKWFKAGADLGDRDAMVALGEAYIVDLPDKIKDEQSGFFWVKKAAELGCPKAMIILSDYYITGIAGEKNIILARYWSNQAVLNGFGQMELTGVKAQQQNFINFWKYADFSPSYVLVDEYGHYLGDGDDGLFKGLITGMVGSLTEYYGHLQEPINGMELIKKNNNGVKIFGGTLSLAFTSKVYLKKGETIHMKTYGVMSMGFFAGTATADGLYGWDEYKFINSIPCGAVIVSIDGANDWKFIGQDGWYTAPQDGPLDIAINGRDRANYKGYFDIVLEKPEGAVQ
ncbi:MAG TPA: tetratricopeptide repeat protein [Chitinophagaceae bacterium]|nr:tetratricopeptide repeat protein [Chitinophagaceae bacterium]